MQPQDDNVTAIVFDLDGTLVDTTPDIAAAINRVLARHGREPLGDAAVHALVGEGARELTRRAFTAAGAPLADDVALDRETRAYLAAYAERPVERSAVHGDAREALAALAARGLALGVATNKETALAWTVLRALDLAPSIAEVAGPDAVAHRKPHPAHLLAVVDALGATPETTVFVGDNVIDVRTAAAAGVRCVLVEWGTAPPDASPTWARIEAFGALLDLVGAAEPSPT
jgi:phosphoglycolate phosphatase